MIRSDLINNQGIEFQLCEGKAYIKLPSSEVLVIDDLFQLGFFAEIMSDEILEHVGKLNETRRS